MAKIFKYLSHEKKLFAKNMPLSAQHYFILANIIISLESVHFMQKSVYFASPKLKLNNLENHHFSEQEEHEEHILAASRPFSMFFVAKKPLTL